MWVLSCILGMGVVVAQERGARSEDATFSGPATGYKAPPRDRLHYTNATYGRINALGITNVFRVGWRRRLSSKDRPLLHNTYVYVAPTLTVTPGFVRSGLFVEAQALSVLRGFVEVTGVRYFGLFNQVMSFSDPTVRYSDQRLAELRLAGFNQPRSGWGVIAGFSVRGPVGPFLVRSTTSFQRYDLALSDGEVVFYDQLWDRLAPDQGFMVLLDTELVVRLGTARLGIRHSFSDDLVNAPGDGGQAHHRLGPVVAWTLADRGPGSRFDRPTLFVVSQWWLSHPYRAGQEQPQGLPLIAVGFAFDGDLISSGTARVR
ncbi:MAG: hypothetical protein AAGA48_23840 [Myxococcota bacterium]